MCPLRTPLESNHMGDSEWCCTNGVVPKYHCSQIRGGTENIVHLNIALSEHNWSHITGGKKITVLSEHHWSLITVGTGNTVLSEHHWNQINGVTENCVLSEHHCGHITGGTEHVALSQHNRSQITRETEDAVLSNTIGVKSQVCLRTLFSQNTIRVKTQGNRERCPLRTQLESIQWRGS